MSIRIITAVMGLGMLYAQAVSASDMVRYDHALFVADASATQQEPASKPATKAKKAKSAKATKADGSAKSKSGHRRHHKHHKHHGHKHHAHKHHAHKHHGHKHYPMHHPKHHRDVAPCKHPRCSAGDESGMVIEPMSLEQSEPNMDRLNRDNGRGSRGGRGR